jgi:hypothetical protein
MLCAAMILLQAFRDVLREDQVIVRAAQPAVHRDLLKRNPAPRTTDLILRGGNLKLGGQGPAFVAQVDRHEARCCLEREMDGRISALALEAAAQVSSIPMQPYTQSAIGTGPSGHFPGMGAGACATRTGFVPEVGRG